MGGQAGVGGWMNDLASKVTPVQETQTLGEAPAREKNKTLGTKTQDWVGRIGKPDFLICLTCTDVVTKSAEI